ncbi:unnamed protein product [Pleuronectes platessa]|uniref:Uncharacterized protein n=1 Tax=Pleuronectes platessa TaxID=8262 RepID=A0A9N7URE9_PLEPL|nr:unnamed protein product [Pleuronectes platessa]
MFSCCGHVVPPSRRFLVPAKCRLQSSAPVTDGLAMFIIKSTIPPATAPEEECPSSSWLDNWRKESFPSSDVKSDQSLSRFEVVLWGVRVPDPGISLPAEPHKLYLQQLRVQMTRCNQVYGEAGPGGGGGREGYHKSD